MSYKISVSFSPDKSVNSADLFALIEPYAYHLHLHPSHLTPPASKQSRTSSSSSSTSTPYSTTRPPSPYTPHILTLLVVSFPFLAFIISLPSFPIRGVCLIAGLLPFFLTHPWTRTVGVFVFQALIIQGLPVAWKRIEELTWKARSFYRDFPSKLWLASTRREEKESEEGYSSSIGENISDVNPIILFKTFLKRLMDDDRLSDSCWNSEMREVELWENERFGGKCFFFLSFFNFRLISFHRFRSCSSFYIPDRSERVYPGFRLRSCLFNPYLVFLFFTASCSSKRLE